MPARRSPLAVLAALLVLLALPSLAAARTFTVNSTANAGQVMEGAGCETAAAKCTFRAAIEAANEDVTKDTIGFDQTLFNGEAAGTITPNGLLPEVKAGAPVVIDGGICATSAGSVPCVTLNTFSGGAGLSVRAEGSVVEHLTMNVGGSVGIRALASNAAEPGVEILGNVIRVPGSPTGTGIELTGPIGGSGNLVEGNTIEVGSGGFSRGIALRDGPNRIYGNTFSGGGSIPAIFAEQIVAPVTGNRIGGDTAASENVIDGFPGGAISLNLGSGTFNEVGRNRGANGGAFITVGSEANGGIQPPAITAAVQSSVAGTASPGAKVRLFRKATESGGEIAGFLGEVEADPSGTWKVAFAQLPVGGFVTATQTLNGGTSQLAAAATLAADPTPPNEEGGGETPGGGTPGTGANPGTGTAPGTGATGSGPPIPAPPPVAAVAPKAKITAAPKASSEATTAMFKFTTTTPGSRFECRLDKAKFARCRSPKTYRGLKPGKHVFRVRAVGPTGLKGAATKRAFGVS